MILRWVQEKSLFEPANLRGPVMAATQERKIAEESLKTRKAREKLQKKLAVLDKEITPEALREKVSEIHRWIALHVEERVVLQTKQIALFDENQNTAAVSRKIVTIATQIQKDIALQPKESEKAGENILRKLIQGVKEKSSAAY